jgi:N-acetylmuramic acid 6-phosphate etherase
VSRGQFGQEAAVTEAANPRTEGIDQLPTAQILRLLLAEDEGVAGAVRVALPSITRAAELLLHTLEGGGRWFNLGAGTSGRIGVLDATELPPTYGLDPGMVQAVLAGGPEAMAKAIEGAEDDQEAAVSELQARGFSVKDTLFALSASGQTPFVLGAVAHARQLGAQTIGLTCSPDSPLARAVAHLIVVRVGPEAIAGSTRLKGGLAEKMVLHMISTTVMIRMGRVRGNLMTELRTQSSKLRERAIRILIELSGGSREEAERRLEEAGGSVSRALEMMPPTD